MNSRQRVEAALNHQQPDRVPLTSAPARSPGMHVSSVYKLRQALKLDPPGTPVKVIEPYQMLGEIAPDLHGRPGRRRGRPGRAARRCSASRTRTGSRGPLFDGTPVLVPGGFNTEPEPNGDILMYPEGDQSAPPSGRMPKGGFYFDTIVRQEPIDDDEAQRRGQPRGVRPDLRRRPAALRREADRLRRESDRAILANFGGTAFGDIALVPAPWLKHPKGIRDVAEWYMSTVARFDYVYEVFEPPVRDRAWRTWRRSTTPWATA